MKVDLVSVVAASHSAWLDDMTSLLRPLLDRGDGNVGRDGGRPRCDEFADKLGCATP